MRKASYTTPPDRKPGQSYMPVARRRNEDANDVIARVRGYAWFARVTRQAPYATSHHWYWVLEAKE